MKQDANLKEKKNEAEKLLWMKGEESAYQSNFITLQLHYITIMYILQFERDIIS